MTHSRLNVYGKENVLKITTVTFEERIMGAIYYVFCFR